MNADATAMLAADPRPEHWRTLEHYNLVRLLASGGMVLAAFVLGAPAVQPPLLRAPNWVLPAAALLYFACAATMALATFYGPRHFRAQVVAQLSLDMVLVTLVMALAGGVGGGLVVAYLLPLAGAALLLPASGALFVCALAAMAVLFDALLRMLAPGGGEAQLFQAGIYGAALFALTGLLRLLSTRIEANARLARARGQDLEYQLELNRLVIAQLDQGVLVVDGDTRVHAANRAVRRLLGLPPNTSLLDRRLTEFPTLLPLAQAFIAWHDAPTVAGQWNNTLLRAVGGRDAATLTMAELRVRARFARPPSESGQAGVIFLDDVRALEEQAQQLKLAAMGRLTASIAHEIRNPLAAIGYAGQLLAEQPQPPAQQRLTELVRENTQRLARLVEDVLRVARREAPLGETLALDAFVADWLAEFERSHPDSRGRVALRLAAGLIVRFEPSHLRQVLVNLVENALRYASARPGGVELIGERAADDRGRVRLWVFDDGPGVTLEARAAMFEPFFTTAAAGTGLGLYLAREFCIANHCELAYAEQRALDGTTREGFRLRFAAVQEADAAAAAGFLDTVPLR